MTQRELEFCDPKVIPGEVIEEEPYDWSVKEIDFRGPDPEDETIVDEEPFDLGPCTLGVRVRRAWRIGESQREYCLDCVCLCNRILEEGEVCQDRVEEEF